MRVLKLVFKNMLRHKLRTMLTVLGIAVAVTAFGLLRTIVTAWNSGVEASGADRLITRDAVSFIFPLPLAYKDKIASLPGVAEVTYANWFGGVYIDKNQFFARLAVEADNYLEVYPECVVPPDQLEAFKKERNACIIGEQLVERYHLKLGDNIPMEGDIYPGHWEFVIRGIYKPRDKVTDPSNMFFHWDYVNERMKQEAPVRADQVGWYVVKVKNTSMTGSVSEKIDQLFENSRAETKTETERAFQQGFLSSAGAILTAMNFVSFVIIGIIMLVLGNTMIMSARERTREYAVFKTLGFSAWHLVGLIAGESLLISCLGAGIGVLLSLPLVQGFAAVLPKGWFPIFNMEPITLILAVVAAVLVGVTASLFPIHRATRTSIVNGLREIG
jgi:putative ABC transport system permease protein